MNREIFVNVKEAQIVIEAWREEYNERRPHSALGYLTPTEYGACCNLRSGTPSLRLQRPGAQKGKTLSLQPVQKMGGSQSNKYNFLMLAAYTAFDILPALILVGILPADFWVYLLFILAVIGSATYNYVILTKIQEMEQK